MDDCQSKLKIVISVPHTRTFLCQVRTNQKIKVILRAFPNEKNINELVFWFDGGQLLLDFTFDEVGIMENSIIIVGIKTDDLLINQYLMFLSKLPLNSKIVHHLMNPYNLKNAQKLNIDKNIIFNEKRYNFIQNLKLKMNHIDFSDKNTEKDSIDPFPII